MLNYIYQIYYSEASRRALDPGFIPLDNSGQRPDWREYWPMRRFLLDTALDETARYGFLSPKFGLKTKLNAAQVFEIANSTSPDTDVITFSPFLDMTAFYTNVFEQGAVHHPGIWPAFERAFGLIAPGCNIRGLVMSSAQTVFCNYIVAKPAFWRQWLAVCEALFAIAEAGAGELGALLNGSVPYGNEPLPAKVFVIERVASLMLSIQPLWKVQSVDIAKMTISADYLGQFTNDMLILDALKYTAISRRFGEYMQTYYRFRSEVAERVVKARHAALGKPRNRIKST